MENQQIKISNTEEWRKVRDYIQTQMLKVRDINYPSTLDEKLLLSIQISNDPLRAGQILAYKVLENILSALLSKETIDGRDNSKDGYK